MFNENSEPNPPGAHRWCHEVKCMVDVLDPSVFMHYNFLVTSRWGPEHCAARFREGPCSNPDLSSVILHGIQKKTQVLEIFLENIERQGNDGTGVVQFLWRRK